MWVGLHAPQLMRVLAAHIPSEPRVTHYDNGPTETIAGGMRSDWKSQGTDKVASTLLRFMAPRCQLTRSDRANDATMRIIAR